MSLPLSPAIAEQACLCLLVDAGNALWIFRQGEQAGETMATRKQEFAPAR
jgi:hypothetical protein